MVFLQLNSSLISLILTAFGARMIKKSNEMENFMKLLEERILKDGVLKDGGILKVDSFLNHQMDIGLLQEIGKEFRRLFPENITRILTIEASGIGCGIVIEKGFQDGGQIIREKGVHLESLAIVEDPKDGKLCFREQ